MKKSTKNTTDNPVRDILDFLTELAANNNREWFNVRKERYLEVKARVEALTGRLLKAVSEFDPGAALLTPSDCLYRIYRDTRFSEDKTPYKTHIGIYICPPYGKQSNLCGYYLHLEPGDCIVAGGAWCPEPPVLRRIRTDIYENVEEYLEIIHDPAFSRLFPRIGEDLLKTAPKGFPKDWEHVELLRPKSFTAYSPLSDEEMCGAGMETLVIERFRALVPFNRFLNYAIAPPED